jgi:hypothetical protein
MHLGPFRGRWPALPQRFPGGIYIMGERNSRSNVIPLTE